MAIQRFSAGQPIRRLTLFNQLGKSPDSGGSRQLVTNSSRYGLTKGSYAAEHLELTDAGRQATSQEVTARDRLQARFDLAVRRHPPFQALYERLKGSKLPSQAVLKDYLLEQGVTEGDLQQCVDTFIGNAKYLGLLRPVAGVERLLPIEHVLEELPASGPVLPTIPAPAVRKEVSAGVPASPDTKDWSKICFYITPIGDENSEQRQHSDLFLGYLVEPAITPLGLAVIRADQIGKPGIITAQVIEHVVRSRLVVADLSFHNPNVFYELSLRHACSLPTVQIIRSADGIPFDLDQFRTIRIDTTSIFTLVPSLETYRSEIANQARRVLENGETTENPLTVFFPGLRVTVPLPAR